MKRIIMTVSLGLTTALFGISEAKAQSAITVIKNDDGTVSLECDCKGKKKQSGCGGKSQKDCAFAIITGKDLESLLYGKEEPIKTAFEYPTDYSGPYARSAYKNSRGLMQIDDVKAVQRVNKDLEVEIVFVDLKGNLVEVYPDLE